MTEPITTAVLGAAAAKAIEKSTESLVDRISFKFAIDKFDQVKFALSKGLPGYLKANYAKCETLKTLLNRNDPIALEDCFVAPDFQLKGTVISSTEFLLHVNEVADKVVITGLAGSGKSVFLKYAFRNVIEKEYSYYPIFFELRSLNGISAKNGFLISEIYKSINSCCDSFTMTQFNHGTKSGAFFFLLDGFDELKHEIREQVSFEIQELARKHHKCAILVTSRPSDDFISWEGFSETALLPFDLEKAIAYLSKLKFDEEKKRDFLADLQGGLFEKHQDFLSNPLLSAMMLLTYDSFGEIPEKRHTFYSKCFDVLAREHDASKGRYKRELFSSLAMEQLEAVFMFFCTMSYVERRLSFSDEEMKRCVGDAISSCGVDADGPSVIRDFRESISIMELVGLEYEFAHRSFQEYFYAKFVVTDRKLSLEEKIGWLCDEFTWDDTIEMIADMDNTYFEDEFLLPNAKALDVKLSKVDPEVSPSAVLSKFFNTVEAGHYRDNGKNGRRAGLSFAISNKRNVFIWLQAVRKYKDKISLKTDELLEEKEKREASEVTILLEKFGGEIKVHHSNNKKLKEVGANRNAAEMKIAISALRRYLEAKQDKRRKGLGVLIRSKYRGGLQQYVSGD